MLRTKVLSVLSLGVVLGAAAMAQADTYTVSGVLANGGTVSGTFSLDMAAQTITGASLMVGGEGLDGVVASQAGGSYLGSTGTVNTWEIYSFYFPAGQGQTEYSLDLLVPQSSVQALAGGAICSTSFSCGAGVVSDFRFGPRTEILLTSGTVTPVAVTPVAAAPEPGSLWLLGTGLVGAIGAGRRRWLR